MPSETPDPARPLDYGASGVDTEREEEGMSKLLAWVQKSFALRPGVGRPLLPIGYFANVIELPGGIGLAVKTDGVGTKILVAEAMRKFDTVGIDCVAMNVNDLVCVGARPLAVLDYIAVEEANPELLGEIAHGLFKGAEMAEVSIPGGEIAQVRDMIRGAGPAGTGFDLVGMAVGIVPVSKINTGRHVKPGDALVGFASSGLHSNGYTLARRVLLEHGRLPLDRPAPGLDRPLGLELLEPTRIYVRETMAMIDEGLPVRALANITGDGLLNLNRIDAECGFRVDWLPEPPPIFGLIQRTGSLPDAEMYRVFNMGVGFCVVVPEAEADRAIEIAKRFGTTAWRLGVAVADRERKLDLAPKKLVGRDDRFA